MKIVKKSTENCLFYSHEKSLYIAWACFGMREPQKNSYLSLSRIITSVGEESAGFSAIDYS